MVELGQRSGPHRARVGFLYIAQAHQVLHSISVAVELARARADIDVSVLATNEDGLAYARSIVTALGGAPLTWALLGPAWLRGAHKAGQTPPKLPMLAANAWRLGRFDMLVAPERTTTALRWLGPSRQKLVYTQHGAGDREGPFEKRLGLFDLVFAAGAKQRDRMVDEGLVTPEACAVVGYPKFDVVDALPRLRPPPFAHDRPVVLYNPHFASSISSWPRWGPEVLAAFADQQDYNLVFAPHVRLFEGRTAADVPALAPFRGHPSIHIDLGSCAAIDMTYTTLADLYLGDVSSQVYEFIRRPRPCLFLNANGVHWAGDESYRHWRFGPVIDTIDKLMIDVHGARQTLPLYAPEQMESFAYTFDDNGCRASRRAADAIMALL
ncbi:MAG: glycerophosphotransferase [Phenylobacterium sp.]